MNTLRALAAAALIAAGSIVAAASVSDLPVKNVNGKMYRYYKVAKKESVYSICHKLGVTKEELVRSNPSVADGLKAGMTLYFPVDEASASDDVASHEPQHQTAQQPVATHKVEPGETIFGLSRKYGVTEAQLKEWNPEIASGLKAGQVLKLGPEARVAQTAAAPAANGTAAPAETEKTVNDYEGYVVKKGESLYSIARAHNITEDELEAANPGIGILKAGQVLSIPVKGAPGASQSAAAQLEAVADAASTIEGATVERVDPSEVPGVKAKPASIALMLPLMLNEENPSKTAQRYTEFYKGFLLAVDSLRNSGKPLNVSTYDTRNSVVTVKEILADSAFSRHTAIIAPDQPAQLALIAEYAKNNGVTVLNVFNVRDDSYTRNPGMLQGNLPSEKMYDKAIDALTERLRYSTPVFLSITDSQPDKAEFIADLKKSLEAKGIASRSIEADGKINVSDLKVLGADGNYTFIPVSSRQADLNKMMPAIIEWRDETIVPIVRLFGYPEWTLFRGETLQNMHNLNTIIYSRFISDYESSRAKALDAKFERWYGTDIENVVPRQGLLGFDSGMFLQKYLQSGQKRYEGIQNSYNFVPAGEGAGEYNDVLYFLNFRPGGDIVKTLL